MKNLQERVSYLVGLCDGLGISEETKEGRVLLEVVDILQEFAESISMLDEEQEEIIDYIESIDEDLELLQDDCYDYDIDDYDMDDEELTVSCSNCGSDVEIAEEELEDHSLDICCPECDEVIVEKVDD